MYVVTKDTPVDCPIVSVSGEGSLFDASRTRLFRFYRDGAMQVCDGARAILPADTKFGESYVGSNELTAPVKLPTKRCPSCEVRSQISEGWYFNSDSTTTGVTVSQSPTYPTHRISKISAKL